SLVPVRVVEQRDPGAPVGVVLDRGDLGRHAVLVPLEVDDPILALVAPTLVTSGDAAVHVPPRALLARAGERLLRLASRDLAEVRDAGAALSRCGRLELSNGHVLRSLRFEDLDGIAGGQRDHGPLL